MLDFGGVYTYTPGSLKQSVFNDWESYLQGLGIQWIHIISRLRSHEGTVSTLEERY